MLGDRLKSLRLFRGLTQAGLAGANCSQHHICRIENNRSVPSPDVLAYLCDKLRTPVSEVLDLYLATGPALSDVARLAVMMAKRGETRSALELTNGILAPALPESQVLFWRAAVRAARSQFGSAYILYRRAAPDLSGELLVRCEFGLGRCAGELGRTLLAYQHYTVCLSMLACDRSDDLRLRALLLQNLANVEFMLKTPAQALRHYLDALPLVRELRDVTGEASCLLGISACYLDFGECARALPLLEKCQALYESAGHADALAKVLNNRAMALRLQGDAKGAVALLERCVRLENESPRPANAIYSLNELTEIHLAAGDLQRARESSDAAVRLADDLESPRERSLTYDLACKVARRSGQLNEGLAFAERALLTLERGAAAPGGMERPVGGLRFLLGEADAVLAFAPAQQAPYREAKR